MPQKSKNKEPLARLLVDGGSLTLESASLLAA